MIDQIQDRESRLFAIAYVVRGHNDYSHPCVLKAYAEVKPQNIFFTVHILQDAIKSNKEFALKETQELIMGYLVSESPYINHDGYELVAVLCKQFCVEMIFCIIYSLK